MRSLNALEVAALASPNRTTRYRVWVDSTGAGAFVNLSSIQGYDFVQEVSYGSSVDQPVDTAQVKLARSVFHLSLNPLMGTSKLNNAGALVAAGRRIYIETVTVRLDAPIQANQWRRVFDGYIDEVDPTGESMTLDCRDLGALLVDTFIETERTYGSTAGVALHTVIQSIITDNINTPGLGNVSLLVPTAPTLLLLTYKQNKQTVMDAITALADQIGWSVRYKWDTTTQAFQLTLYVPDRAKTTADYSFGPDDYYDIKGLKVSRKDVRNVVQVVYDDKSVSTALPLRQRVIVQDLTSIAQYGRRWMEMAEASTSQIDTAAEANTMAQAALADLSQPYADHQVEADYHFCSELGDLYTFLANGQHYDAAQKFAVVGVKHDLTPDQTRSTFTTRGKPSTGYRRWLRLEGRPGVGPSAGYADPSAPTSVVAYAALGATTIECVPPDPNNWTRTEVFMDTSAVPVAAQSNGKYQPLAAGILVAKGKETKFSITGLVPGQTYYGRVQVIDRDGNRSAASGQFSVTTEQVSGYHMNPDTTNAILNANSDFNAFTKGLATFPDSWGRADNNSVWGSGQSVYYDVNAASGKFCVTLLNGSRGLASNAPGGGEGGIRTANGAPPAAFYIPFAANDILCCSAWIKWGTVPAGFTSIEACLILDFYDANKTWLYMQSVYAIASSANAPGTDVAPDGWYMGLNTGANTPSTCRYVAVTVRRYGNNGTSSTPNPWGTAETSVGLYVDRVTLTRGNPAIISGLQGMSGNQYIVPNTPTPIRTFDNSGDISLGFKAPTSGSNFSEWVCILQCTMSITFGCNVTSLNTTDFTLLNVWLEVYDVAKAQWMVVANQSFRQDANQPQDVNLSVAAQAFKPGDKLRALIQETHEANVLNSSVSLLAACIDRKDK